MKKILLHIVLVLFASSAFGEDIADIRKAAEQGLGAAQSSLGSKYYHGEGVLKDYKEAVKWYRKAAEQGDEGGLYFLGRMYEEGKGVPKDNVNAYALYELSASTGDELASKNRERIAQQMTPEQIAKAQELSKELLKKIEANKAKNKK